MIYPTVNFAQRSLTDFVDGIRKSKLRKQSISSEKTELNLQNYQYQPTMGGEHFKNTKLYDGNGQPRKRLNFFKQFQELSKQNKFPGDDQEDKTQHSAGQDYIKKQCCDVSASSCYPSMNCLQRNYDKIERAFHCGIIDSDACDIFQEAYENFEEGITKVNAEYNNERKRLNENIAKDEAKIQSIIDSNDTFSDASIAAKMALIKLKADTTIQNIKSTKEGHKLVNQIENSIFSKYLEKKINQKLGLGHLEESADILKAICSKIDANQCPKTRAGIPEQSRKQQGPDQGTEGITEKNPGISAPQ